MKRWQVCMLLLSCPSILLTKITFALNDVALSYHRVRGLYSVAVIFAVTMIMLQGSE